MNNYHSPKPYRDSSWDHYENDLSSTATSTMERYLLDQDRPFFTSSTRYSVDPSTHAFLGDLFDAGDLSSDGVDESHRVPPRRPSPSSSGLESSGVSSTHGDLQETPWSSPELSSVPRIWRGCEIPSAVFGDHSYADQNDSFYTSSGVAMTDLQYHHTDAMALEDDAVAGYALYSSQPQVGYHPMLHPSDGQAIDTEHNIPSTVYHPQEHDSQEVSPPSESNAVINRRHRPQVSRSRTSPSRAGRGSRRIQLGRRSSHHTAARPELIGNLQPTPVNSGAFPCPLLPYGCASTFGSKNEWKRHLTTQHMRLGFWRCVWCHDRKPNDFNRKDLFIQHVRRMHSQELVSRSGSSKKSEKDTKDEQAANAASERCYLDVRSPPMDSQCLMCDEHFHGPGSWEQRMEHVGRHLESARKGFEASINPQDWREDTDTHGWMANEGIIVRSDRRWALPEKP